MIHEMCRVLDGYLRARKFPIRVFYGPERHGQDNFRSRILIERDRQAGDLFESVPGSKRNARLRAVRSIGCVARIWAKAETEGPLHHNHEDLCDCYVDALHTALQDWVKQVAKDSRDANVTAGRLLEDEEVKAHTKGEWPGVVYEMKFTVPRGVPYSDGEGLGQPESGENITGVENTTNVYREKGPEGAPPEQGCGP